MSPVAYRVPTGRRPAGPVYDSARHHALAALVAAVVGVAAFALIPSYARQTTRTDASGAQSTTTTHVSPLAVNGPRVLLLGLIPIALVALAALVPRRFRAVACAIATVLLIVFIVISAMSMGVFLAPAACLLCLATAAAFRERRA